MVTHLEIIDRDVMQHFDKVKLNITIAAQPRWTEPVRYYLITLMSFFTYII